MGALLDNSEAQFRHTTVTLVFEAGSTLSAVLTASGVLAGGAPGIAVAMGGCMDINEL